VPGGTHHLVDLRDDRIGRPVGADLVGVDAGDPPQLGVEVDSERRPDRDLQGRGQVEHRGVVRVLITAQPARGIAGAGHVDGGRSGVEAQRSILRMVLDLHRPPPRLQCGREFSAKRFGQRWRRVAVRGHQEGGGVQVGPPGGRRAGAHSLLATMVTSHAGSPYTARLPTLRT
jgi:hypothetical protein